MEAFYQALHSIGYTHPVHPTMVYLPIGCVMAAFIFALLSLLFRGRGLSISARHCVVLALVGIFPAVALGYMDWQYIRGGTWVFAIKMKIGLAAVLFILLLTAFLRQWKSRAQKDSYPGLYALCFVTVVAIGYFGGELVFGGDHAAKHQAHSPNDVEKESEQAETTYADIAGILDQNCTMCHKGERAPHGLRLDSYEQVMAGSDHGKAVIAGEPENSDLILHVKAEKEPAMPYMQEPLAEDDIALLERWVQQGAAEDQKPQ